MVSSSSRVKNFTDGLTFVRSNENVDIWAMSILCVVIFLVCMGLVMLSSASMVWALRKFGEQNYFFKRQVIYALLGFGVMAITSQIKIASLRKLTLPILLISFIGLILCLTPLSTSAKGASRWISIGFFNFQPSEMAKIGIIFYIAHSMGRKAEKIKSFTVGFLPHLIVASIFALLCIKEPDFGSASLIMILCFVLLFIGGTRLGYILASIVAMTPVAIAAIAFSPYRMRRLMSFLNPEKDILGMNYQINESLISIGSGGIWGKGIGGGMQKLLFLPDAHTDFIASIIGEELGFVGIVCLLILFGIIVFSGIKIAFRCKDLYSMYLASGISLYLGLQTAINLMVVMGLLPTKGMTLPFLSYGGSSLIVNLFAVGILLAVAKQNNSTNSNPISEVFGEVK